MTGEYDFREVDTPVYDKTLDEVVACCNTDKDYEGYVITFEDCQMVKCKTEWYVRNHRIRTELRERDVADMVVEETIDDIKSFCATNGYDIAPVLEIEKRVVEELELLTGEVYNLASVSKDTSDKNFALANRDSPLFGLVMAVRKGKEPDFKKFWNRNMREKYSLITIYRGL